MHISTSSLLGIIFLGLSFAATFSMFHLWGYEYDEVNKKSSAPQWKMNIHRGIGFAYIIIYIIMMTEMVPRLWEYQVEFPARTVVHVVLGTIIGVVLLIKVSIIRFFRHLEEWMPALGVSLFMCTVLLAVMSLPAFYQEKALADGAVGGSVYSEENRARVAKLLPDSGLPEGVNIKELSSVKSLEKGRKVLRDKCIKCHDLKTVIGKVRTPSDWVRTSKRMALKPSLTTVISDEESYLAATYLIAITPDLQRSAKTKRDDDQARNKSANAVEEMFEEESLDAGVAPLDSDAGAGAEIPDAGPEIDPKNTDPKGKKPKGKKPKGKKPPKDKPADTVKPVEKPVEPKVEAPPKPKYDAAKAKELFNDECSLCHGISDVNDAPPTTRDEVNSVLRRMVSNGLDLEKEDLSLIRKYMIRRYVKK